MENFPGYNTDPKVRRTVKRCHKLGQINLKQRKNPDKWYDISTLRGTKCTKSAARRRGTDPDSPGLTILYDAAVPSKKPKVDVSDTEEYEEDEEEYEEQEQQEQQYEEQQYEEQQEQQEQQGGASNSLLSDYRLQRYIARHGLYFSKDMPVLFDLALSLTSDPSRVLEAAKITHNGNLFVPLSSI